MGVFLDIDLGELPDEPEELYALATVVNVACGGHAGDEASMRRAVELAVRTGARVGAHPSYPDRAGFGRASLAIGLEELYESLVEQCDELVHIARRAGTRVTFAKLHGALYHDAASRLDLAAATLDGIVSAIPDGPTIIGPSDGRLAGAARARGLPYAAEGFADRRYEADGKLVPRSHPGALLDEPAAAARQAVELARAGTVEALCVHGDTPNAVPIARAVREALLREGLLAGLG